MKYDVAIIGGGISGVSIAFELSKYNLNVVLLEKENDVSMMTTKANSGIVHAGYDPLPNTEMARFNVLGNKIIHELAEKIHFPFKPLGSLVVGKTMADHEKINLLFERGIRNQVPGLRILKTRKEVHDVEPYLVEDIDYALYAPTCSIVSPWELCLGLAYTAKINGVDFCFNAKVTCINKKEDGFVLSCSSGDICASYVVNCAGLYADDIYGMVLKNKEEGFVISPCKGEYFLLDKEQGHLANHVVFQCPTKLGKGVLVSPTVHGNLLVGPNASFEGEKEDVSTRMSSLAFIKTASKESIGNIDFMTNIRNFSGERATIQGRDDFLIEESRFVPHFINVAGIKSPGLTSAPAFGIKIVEILKQDGVRLEKKREFSYYEMKKPFKEMTLEGKDEAIREDYRYGNIICRCETVTEKEIIDSIHAPIPARSIDGIKRRCNAGMGRCQGGFCSPKVFHLLQKEANLGFDQVFQDREGSCFVKERTKE